MKIVGMLFTAAGIISICGAVFNWDSFFRYYKAAHLVNLFGRTGARVVYALIGIFATVGGISMIASGHL